MTDPIDELCDMSGKFDYFNPEVGHYWWNDIEAAAEEIPF